MRADVISFLKVLRRNAYLMTGRRDVADVHLHDLLTDPAARPAVEGLALVPALQMLYLRLPQEPVAGADAAVAALCGLPFYNRAAVALRSVQGLPAPLSAAVLVLTERAVDDLLSMGLKALRPAPDAGAAPVPAHLSAARDEGRRAAPPVAPAPTARSVQ